ncbi:hypothetical protein SMSP2_01331 [Limihaloglobus sulfuriphilus]|uniref:Uncharacterized protein n=1 Tax=Limihaloglobus sulfuriphilus TaxID=1851148 RepID=A0A1Q2MF97_9BACT|nr:hypothetical protein [Limihaloglobus sulfuriphilus]AQQ70967.1 hypothetical protein SMSP2_01331 [Limihaloglobus sulfuriphilus]
MTYFDPLITDLFSAPLNSNLPEAPARDAKFVPTEIETRYFRQARITGYRLKKAG